MFVSSILLFPSKPIINIVSLHFILFYSLVGNEHCINLTPFQTTPARDLQTSWAKTVVAKSNYNSKKILVKWVWWSTTLIQALGGQRQMDLYEFKDNLLYIVSGRAWAT